MLDPQSASEAPVKEGDVLAGKYRVEKVLGVGGMGVVVRALHTDLDERVALKFLLPAAAQSPAVVARFAREAKAAAKIKSQHVARVSDVGSLEGGIPYIVMEYLEGIDLADMLERDKKLPHGAAVDFVLQACEAIAEAHAAGFIHRDLKPANLFLANQADGGAIIKVLDFGISKAVIADEPSTPNANALTRTTDIFGSPMYMSPEQLKSSRDVDVRADIWALGVILYELISGRAPFDRPTVAETFGAILYETPPRLRKTLPDVPEELNTVIARCLEKELPGRMPNVAELSKALVPFAASVTRASSDRTSRVLRRAGVTIDSVPPPSSMLLQAAKAQAEAGVPSSARAQTNVPPGAQTRSAWDTGQVQRPRSGRSVTRTALVALLTGALLAGGGFFAMKRWPGVVKLAFVGVRPERPTPQPGAAGPAQPTPTVTAQPTPTVTVQPTPAVTAQPSGRPAAPSAIPASGPSATPSTAPSTAGKAPGRGPRGQSPGVVPPANVNPTVVAPAPAVPVQAPATPTAAPKPPGDPDWGTDRQ